MQMEPSKELQIKEKQVLPVPAEQTRPGLVFTPAVDIFESDREIMLLADMPGTSAEDITIDLRDGILTLTGDVKPWEKPDESDVFIEFEIGKYYRQFTLSEMIDQTRIEAGVADGVLRLSLPKAEKAIPRKISVKSA
jgi:HSP20 family molecular chaperone IbpA